MSKKLLITVSSVILFCITMFIISNSISIKSDMNSKVNNRHSNVKESKVTSIRINKITSNNDIKNSSIRKGNIRIGKYKKDINSFLDANGDVSYNKIRDFVYPRLDKIIESVEFHNSNGGVLKIGSIENIRDKVYTSICCSISRYIEGEDVDIEKVILNKSLGNTYIEIDSINKIMYLYIEGELKVKSIITLTVVQAGIYFINDLNENITVDNYFINKELSLSDGIKILNAVWELEGISKDKIISVSNKDIKELFYWSFISMPVIVY